MVPVLATLLHSDQPIYFQTLTLYLAYPFLFHSYSAKDQILGPLAWSYCNFHFLFSLLPPAQTIFTGPNANVSKSVIPYHTATYSLT